jgi:SpoIIAA-like
LGPLAARAHGLALAGVVRDRGAEMLEVLSGFPDGVIAVRAKGHVTRKDYEDVLVPKVRDAFARRQKVRCFYELGPEYAGFDPGAMWEDFKLGMGHLAGWERVAIVTDVDWIRHAMNIFRVLMPGTIRLFANADAAEARRWIASE